MERVRTRSVRPGTKLLPTILPGGVATIAVSLTGKVGVRQEGGDVVLREQEVARRESKQVRAYLLERARSERKTTAQPAKQVKLAGKPAQWSRLKWVAQPPVTLLG